MRPLATYIPSKWQLTLHVLPLVFGIVAVKFAVHHYGLEVLSLSPLMGAIISANVFLVGFLISGVLVDYKESERLPGELACSLEALTDESSIVYMNTKNPIASELHHYVGQLVCSTLEWLHKKERTTELLGKIVGLNSYFLAFEALTQANFIARMKQEQSSIRRVISG